MSKTGGGQFLRRLSAIRRSDQARHAAPPSRWGDVALYKWALFGSALLRSSPPTCFARAIGYPCSPVDDLARLSRSCSARNRTGHFAQPRSPISAMPPAACFSPVYPGDTLSAESEVIGLKGKFEPQDRYRVSCARPVASRTAQKCSSTCAGVMVRKAR